MLDNKKTVIALGYFDCVHIGHQEVIKRAKEVSKSLDANLVVFSFDGNLKGAINSGDGTYIYNKEETYNLTISNLLSNAIVIYQTKGLDDNYSFIGFSNARIRWFRGYGEISRK